MKESKHGLFICLNGVITSAESARISPFDRGFLYGDGLFETIRCYRGRPLFLEEHLERLFSSARALDISLSDNVPWAHWIQETLSANGLHNSIARIKIVVSRGEVDQYGLLKSGEPTIIVYALPCALPTSEEYRTGYRLMIAPVGYSPPLARQKTLNYLYYEHMRAEAHRNDCDDAVLLDPDGYVTESTKASLLIEMNGDYILPSSDYKLLGITETVVERILDRKYIVTRQDIRPEELAEADAVYVLNSIVLVMPVREIVDVGTFAADGRQAEFLREELSRQAGKSH
jgi:branched-chain amino acid aminotransferase/para-aminobenzoate synthetase component 1